MTQAEERETMELDVLFIGAGPANLCAAYRLMRGIEAHNEKAQAEGKPAIEPPTVLVIDKASKIGNHNLSGAVVDPVAFKELFPELPVEEYPFITPVAGDKTFNLISATGKVQLPAFLLPPAMHNGSNFYIASISELTRFLAKKCEEVGVEVYTEFAAVDFIRDGGKIAGVKIGDKGLDKEGNPSENFAAGMDLLAKITVLGEGTFGYLSQQLISEFNLDAGANTQNWSLGLKEVIEIPVGRVKKGEVIHTFGYPLDMSTYGGSFVYAIEDNVVAMGIVFGLDYVNPRLNSHELLLQLKKHPLIASIIEGGKVVEYGAKTLPEGGWWAIPQLSVDGAVLVGDSAGILNAQRLKGIHLAMKSGMLAADRMVQAFANNDFSAKALDYRADLDACWAGKELHLARNVRQGFHHGLIPGMILTGLHMFTGGAIPGGRATMPPDHASLKHAAGYGEWTPQATDVNLNLDILTDVYKSGSIHNEHQASHCKIVDPEKC
ncbi:TPA: electron transfer flavoprotein, partial [Candidatus Sumerlaeota bacterium]|nr:electron transfer flavoprotein [Candidatus Sumerlaeota bacterium]